MQSTYKVLLTVLALVSYSEQAPEKRNDKKKEVELLEKEKSELYNQINSAIEESVKSFLHSNTSEAALGLNYIKDLKRQLKELNTTGEFRMTDADFLSRRHSQGGLEIEGKEEAAAVDDDLRRQLPIPADRDTEKMMDLDKIFGKKNSKKYKKRLFNRLKIQKQLDEWLYKKQLEANKIKTYRDEQDKIKGMEKCPKEGRESKKKGAQKKGGGKKGAGSLYPCCRKCCKRSYMGCL